MAFIHGKSAYVAIGTSGSETSITPYTSKVGWPRQVAKADTTVFGLSDETSLPGIKSYTVSMAGKYDPTLHTLMTGLLAVSGKSIVVGPAGNGTGNTKMSAGGYLSKYEWNGDIGSAEDWTAEFTVSGVVTDTVF
jgi:hypothetical protein